MSAPRLTPAEAAALGIEPQLRYEQVINQIVAGQGAFISVNPDDLCGTETVSKQSALLRAARTRGLRITTTCRKPGVIYARVVINQ